MDNWNNFNSDSGSGDQSDGNNRVEHTASGLQYEHVEPNFVIRDYSEDGPAASGSHNTDSEQQAPQHSAPVYGSSYGYGGTSSNDSYGLKYGAGYDAGGSYGSSFGGGNGGYGGGYGNGGSGYDDGGHKNRRQRTKKAKIPMQITKKAFVLILILCMLATSALTVGGMYVYGNYFAAGTNSATNYTLSKSTETLSYKSIISKAQDSVVSITTESVSTDTWAQNYVTEGAGSGVIIQSNGYIVTCNHVISGASKITVTLNNKKKYSATVVGTDSENDVAVLKIKATGLTAATYGDSSKLQVGDTVVAIGNPLGQLSNTATTGIISALNRNLTIEGQSMNLLQTDASINPGNSGGALFNSSGNLIGIVVAKSTGSDVEGLGFAIPINKVAKVAKDLIKNGSSSSSSSTTTSSKAAIGVSVTYLSASEAQEYGYSNAGVYIASVTSSNAQSAGLKSGDMLYSVGGTKITSTDSLKSALSKYSPGDKAKIKVIRDNRTITVTVTLTTATS
jgi:serine protease Do